jgi:Pyruvate/2-oxoacid:ferredoxin oxidoreductase gamma subunit
MNRPSLEKFESILKPGGALIYNSTLIEIEPGRGDVEIWPVPITGMADELGSTRIQSMVAVGAFAAVTGIFGLDDLLSLMPKLFPGSSLVELNQKAVRAGFDYVVAHRKA